MDSHKKYLRYFLILTVFLSAVSFAGEVEEQRELQAIVNQIVRQIDPSKSVTRLLSLELIKRKVENGPPANLDDDYIERVGKGVVKKLGIANSENIGPADLLDEQCADEQTATNFARILNFAWQKQTAKCHVYASLAMAIFEFNYMNNPKKYQALFKEIVFAGTKTGTGMHRILLVEGKSGAVFVVDPWINYVGIIEHFPSLAYIRYLANEDYMDAFREDVSGYETTKIYPILNNVPINGMDLNLQLNSQLNLLYRDKKTGYYDGYYIKEDTLWVISVYETEIVQRFIRSYDNGLKDFYDRLLHIFPHWMKYNDLMGNYFAQCVKPEASTKCIQHGLANGQNDNAPTATVSSDSKACIKEQKRSSKKHGEDESGKKDKALCTLL